MSIYRHKGSKVWTMDFMFLAQRIRESSGTRSKTLAKKIEDKRRRELEEGASGIRKRQQPQLFSVAAEEWLERKRPGWSPGMATIAKTTLAHLLPAFGKRLLVDLEAKDIAKYQKARSEEGAANRTVNLEVAMLRQVLRRHGVWARIQCDVRLLPERDDVGRAISAEEESALLLECGRSRSRCLLPFVALALCTGARYNTIRTLQWHNIDFASRCLRFGKDKTASGTGRTVPLSQRAVDVLTFWAQQFPNRIPEHYVFPTEKVAGVSAAKFYATDPGKPVGDIKEAWEAAKRRTRRHCPNCGNGILADNEKPEKEHFCTGCGFTIEELPAGLVAVRFHDLRHTFVSRAIAARVPLPMIAKIVGWSAGTMAKMAARYGHFGMEELRCAVEAVGGASAKPIFDAGSPSNPPSFTAVAGRNYAN